MRWEFFVAKNIVFKDNSKVARPIINIALVGVVISLAVMIVSVAIVSGFKQIIKDKVTGFAAHMEITAYETNFSYETKPINKEQKFLPYLSQINGIRHIQTFATKSGIIKTKDNFQGIVLKGIGRDFDWKFLSKHLVSGDALNLQTDTPSNGIIISKKIATLLNLKVNDKIVIYFIQDPPRFRKLTVKGIYDTDFEEFDKIFAFVDIRHIQKLNGWNENQVSGFEIFINNFDDIDKIKEKVSDLVVMSSYEQNSEFLNVKSIKDLYPYIFDWISLFNTNVFVIIFLLVTVASINLASGLLILILDKTQTIGILKALGATNRSISRIFVNVGSISVSKGILWGNILGIILVAVQYFTHLVKLDPESYYVDYVPVSLHISHLIILNAGVFIITVMVLVFPSLIVSRITPAKAIKFN
jgi:lipoprotein-releasing system permease protein